MLRCPGQDQRFWRPEDVFEVQCPGCDSKIEFFKDEPKLKCPKCGQMVVNPRIDLGCVEWCKFAEQCLEDRQTPDSGALADKKIDGIRGKIRSRKCRSKKEK